VTDNTGAAVPNAQVQILESATGIQHAGVSNESGNFTFPNLSPGTYTVTAESQGFKKVTRTNVDVVVNTTTRVDLIVAPTTPNVAFKHGEKTDPIAMYLNDVFTIPADMSGVPAVSVPCGFTASGLPIGLQLIGRALDEATVLRAARAYERATDWHTRHPQLS